MKTNLNIQAIEQKVGASGKQFAKIKTSSGMINCFDDAIVAHLQQNLNKDVSVEVQEKNGYKNISAFYGIADGLIQASIKPFEEQSQSKLTSMYVSYAKDVFIALLAKDEIKDHLALIDEAISLVNRVKEAF